MFTIRNLGGVALFLFGTTYLWLTPMFAGKDVSTKGALWTVSAIGSWIVLAGFTVATWGLFRQASWWEAVAVGSAVAGIAVLVPYWIAADRAGETTPGFNVLIHVVGATGVLVLLLVPTLETWVDGHVMSGA
ncbi:hypothetical protein EKO23_11955 [Nocardioides guangzhouensis]|uniref:Uncharacterized protein n=1 Tax=Nocardioides guangzhouensis TaxID=2497878 RepID=A0A4Q4ZDA2_9ACTN|nr:hypothetical protein [Nocardioides guangzhouensis]RYP85708.1 hypothetical protein EKO23_11955 [Nocardioides guangzhouensis]